MPLLTQEELIFIRSLLIKVAIKRLDNKSPINYFAGGNPDFSCFKSSGLYSGLSETPTFLSCEICLTNTRVSATATTHTDSFGNHTDKDP